jgi:TorA maturation chaperone TorD
MRYLLLSSLSVMKRALSVLFYREERVTEETLRRIRAAEGQEAFAQEMDDARIVPQRVVTDGSPPSKVFSKVGIRVDREIK